MNVGDQIDLIIKIMEDNGMEYTLENFEKAILIYTENRDFYLDMEVDKGDIL